MNLLTNAKVLNRNFIIAVIITAIYLFFFSSVISIFAFCLSLYLYIQFILENNIVEIALNDSSIKITYYNYFKVQTTSFELDSVEIKSTRIVEFRGGVDYELHIIDKGKNRKFYSTKKQFKDNSTYELFIVRLMDIGFRVSKNY